MLEIFEKEAIDIFINYNKSQIDKVLEPKNIKYIDKKEEIKEKVEIKSLKRGEALMFVGDNHILTKIECSDSEKKIIEGEKNN